MPRVFPTTSFDDILAMNLKGQGIAPPTTAPAVEPTVAHDTTADDHFVFIDMSDVSDEATGGTMTPTASTPELSLSSSLASISDLETPGDATPTHGNSVVINLTESLFESPKSSESKVLKPILKHHLIDEETGMIVNPATGLFVVKPRTGTKIRFDSTLWTPAFGLSAKHIQGVLDRMDEDAPAYLPGLKVKAPTFGFGKQFGKKQDAEEGAKFSSLKPQDYTEEENAIEEQKVDEPIIHWGDLPKTTAAAFRPAQNKSAAPMLKLRSKPLFASSFNALNNGPTRSVYSGNPTSGDRGVWMTRDQTHAVRAELTLTFNTNANGQFDKSKRTERVMPKIKQSLLNGARYGSQGPRYAFN